MAEVDLWLVGFAPAAQSQAVAELGRVFNVQPAQAQALLDSLPRTVKVRVSQEVADTFGSALRDIGALVEVTAHGVPYQAPDTPPDSAFGPPEDAPIDLGIDAAPLDLMDGLAPAPATDLAPIDLDTDVPPMAPRKAPPIEEPPVVPRGLPVPQKVAAPPKDPGITPWIVLAIMLGTVVFQLTRERHRGSIDDLSHAQRGLDRHPYEAMGERMPRGGGGGVPLDEVDFGETEEALVFLNARDTEVYTEGRTRMQVENLVRALYSSGVPEVLFADIEMVGNTRVSELLVVGLPSIPDLRNAIHKQLKASGWTIEGNPEDGYLEVYLAD